MSTQLKLVLFGAESIRQAPKNSATPLQEWNDGRFGESIAGGVIGFERREATQTHRSYKPTKTQPIAWFIRLLRFPPESTETNRRRRDVFYPEMYVQKTTVSDRALTRHLSSNVEAKCFQFTARTETVRACRHSKITQVQSLCYYPYIFN